MKLFSLQEVERGLRTRSKRVHRPRSTKMSRDPRSASDLSEILQKDGGGTARALKSPEMSKWWTFIAFDLAEPVLILETSDSRHYFVFSFSHGTVISVDELNGLP